MSEMQTPTHNSESNEIFSKLQGIYSFYNLISLHPFAGFWCYSDIG